MNHYTLFPLHPPLMHLDKYTYTNENPVASAASATTIASASGKR